MIDLKRIGDFMIDIGDNLVLKQELFLLWDGVRREWKRVLYANQRGQAVELLLTPSNPRKRDNWENVARMIVHSHRTFNVYGNGVDRRGDRLWRYVIRNSYSIVFNEVRNAMMKQLTFEVVNNLLYGDLLPQIDWEAYAANAQPGGCAFALCKTRPRR